jgi:hypothetical protein
VQQKAEFVLWCAEFKLVVTVQHKWLKLYPGEKAPDDKALNCWLKQLKEIAKCCKIGLQIDRELWKECEVHRQPCVRRPKKSTVRSSELGIPKTMIQNVIHKHLHPYA